mgnify:CR=1 FL=1
MGSGGTNIPVLAIVIAWFGVARRGLATGITVSGSSFALLVTGIVVPKILAAYGAQGWRYAWYSLAGATLVIAAVCAIVLRNAPSEKGLLSIGHPGTTPPPRPADKKPADTSKATFTPKPDSDDI